MTMPELGGYDRASDEQARPAGVEQRQLTENPGSLDRSGSGNGARRAPGETRTRQEYASDMRARGDPIPVGQDPARDPPPAQEQDSLPDGRQNSIPREDLTEPRGALLVAPSARTRDEYAKAVREHLPGGSDTSEIGDGTGEKAPADSDSGNDQISGGAEHDRSKPGRDSLQAEDGPGKVYVDGREIEVTHDPRDGLWIQGMGEIPNAPIGDPYGTGKTGDVMTSGEATKRTRLDRFMQTAVERFDDIAEQGQRLGETASGALENPRPTGTEIRRPGPDSVPSVPDRADTAGHAVAAVLAVAVIGAVTARKARDIWERHQPQVRTVS
jgi:hypothetical protein